MRRQLIVLCLVLVSACGGESSTPDAPTPKATLSVSALGGGRVTSTPDGIACGDDCAEELAIGTYVTLNAAPDPSTTFRGWSGGACTGIGTCQLTLEGNTTVVATFVAEFALEVSKDGTGTGSVASSPGGIACGADCTETFDSGTVVTLTAMADASSTFTGWSSAGCSGTGTCEVTLDQARTVTATFTLDR